MFLYFFAAFALVLNFLTAHVTCYVPYEYYIEGATTSANLALSAVWMLFWGSLLFVFYSCLYKAIAHRRKGHYRVFVSGTAAGAVLAALAVAGIPYTGLCGFVIALMMPDVSSVISLSITAAVLFGLDFFSLFSSLSSSSTTKYSVFCKTGSAPVTDDIEVSGEGLERRTAHFPAKLTGKKDHISFCDCGAKAEKAKDRGAAGTPC